MCVTYNSYGRDRERTQNFDLDWHSVPSPFTNKLTVNKRKRMGYRFDCRSLVSGRGTRILSSPPQRSIHLMSTRYKRQSPGVSTAETNRIRLLIDAVSAAEFEQSHE
jgi:hypothetical protein